MVNSNANLRKMIAPKSNLMCNINLVKMNDKASFETNSKSRIADKVPLCAPSKPLVSKSQAEKCSSSSAAGSAKSWPRTTATSAPSPSPNAGKRQQHQRKQPTPARAGAGRKTVKSDRMVLDPVFQKHPFINVLPATGNESPRDQRLRSVKHALQNQLVQISQNRALNKLLLNAGSGSVCDIIRETQQRAHSDKHDKSNDLGQKTSAWPKAAAAVAANHVQIANRSQLSPKKSTSAAQATSAARPKTSNPKKREKAFLNGNCGPTKRAKNGNSGHRNAAREKSREANVEVEKTSLGCPAADNLPLRSDDLETNDDQHPLALFDEFRTSGDGIASSSATSTTSAASTAANPDLNGSKSLSFSNFTDDIDINSLLSQLPIHSFDLLSNELITSSWPGTADYVI